MKSFHKYKLSKNDKYLIKNFKLNYDYIELNHIELDKYWLKIINNPTQLKTIYNNIRNQRGYLVMLDNKEFFICTYYEKLFYQILCYDVYNRKEVIFTDNKIHITLFSIISTILNKDTNINNYISFKIKLPKKKTKLWFKLINKLNKDKKFSLYKSQKCYYYMYRGVSVGYSKLNTLEYIRSYKRPFLDSEQFIQTLIRTNQN